MIYVAANFVFMHIFSLSAPDQGYIYFYYIFYYH